MRIMHGDSARAVVSYCWSTCFVAPTYRAFPLVQDIAQVVDTRVQAALVQLQEDSRACKEEVQRSVPVGGLWYPITATPFCCLLTWSLLPFSTPTCSSRRLARDRAARTTNRRHLLRALLFVALTAPVPIFGLATLALALFSIDWSAPVCWGSVTILLSVFCAALTSVLHTNIAQPCTTS